MRFDDFSAVEIVLYLKKRGVRLRRDGDRLVAEGPRKVIDEVGKALRLRRRELMVLIRTIERGGVFFNIKPPNDEAERQQEAET